MQKQTDLTDPVAAGIDKVEDLLIMLGVDPSEVQEHGGPTTAEVLVRAVLNGVEPLIVAAYLEWLVGRGGFKSAMVADNDHGWDLVLTKQDLLDRARQLRGDA